MPSPRRRHPSTGRQTVPGLAYRCRSSCVSAAAYATGAGRSQCAGSPGTSAGQRRHQQQPDRACRSGFARRGETSPHRSPGATSSPAAPRNQIFIRWNTVREPPVRISRLSSCVDIEPQPAAGSGAPVLRRQQQQPASDRTCPTCTAVCAGPSRIAQRVFIRSRAPDVNVVTVRRQRGRTPASSGATCPGSTIAGLRSAWTMAPTSGGNSGARSRPMSRGSVRSPAVSRDEPQTFIPVASDASVVPAGAPVTMPDFSRHGTTCASVWSGQRTCRALLRYSVVSAITGSSMQPACASTLTCAALRVSVRAT